MMRLPSPSRGDLPGPAPELDGWHGTIREIPFSPALGEKAGLSFWFRLSESLSSGPDRKKTQWTLLRAAGAFRLSLSQSPASVGLEWEWEGVRHSANNMRLLLPSLPADVWLHWAAVWDSDQGIFDCALNGTELRETGTRLPPWPHPAAVSTVVADATHVWLAGIEGRPGEVSLSWLCREIPPKVRGSCRTLLGASPLGMVFLSAAVSPVLLHSDALGEGLNPKNWVTEGPGKFEAVEGALRVGSTGPGVPETGHVVFWQREDLPADFLVEWEFRPVSPHGLAIAFFSARGLKGEDLFDPLLAKRDGTFPQYHSGDLNCYHISYYTNTPASAGRLTGTLRKNRGFHLVSNGPSGIPAASHDWHKISLLKRGGHIQLAVDGERVIDWVDGGKTFGPVWREGKFGLRQMSSSIADYRNLAIYKL